VAGTCSPSLSRGHSVPSSRKEPRFSIATATATMPQDNPCSPLRDPLLLSRSNEINETKQISLNASGAFQALIQVGHISPDSPILSPPTSSAPHGESESLAIRKTGSASSKFLSKVCELLCRKQDNCRHHKGHDGNWNGRSQDLGAD
jgi:hypothetical protein